LKWWRPAAIGLTLDAVGRSLVLAVFFAALLWPAASLAATGQLVNGTMI
jgi:hypothetical protein